MAKKPLRVFKSPAVETNAKKVQVYKGARDADRSNITQQVLERPETAQVGASSTRYESLLHCIYDAVLIADEKGSIYEVNARAESFFMLSARDLCTRNVTEMIAGADEQLLTMLRHNVSDRRYTVLEAVCLRADQTRFNVEIVVNRIRAKNSSDLCFFIRDITDRKQADEDLRAANDKLVEAERMQARMDTLATLYHELNNPLQIMMCMSELDKNTEYRNQLSRILSVLDQLRKDQSLDPIVESDGTTRYAIEQTVNLEPCNPQKILVVDDEQVLREVFVSALKGSLPYMEVNNAANGLKAIESFDAQHHSVIIMDVAMPELNGEEAFHKIEELCRQKAWQLPSFVFCTGFVVSPSLETITGDGSQHICLQKPLSMNELMQAVQSRLVAPTA